MFTAEMFLDAFKPYRGKYTRLCTVHASGNGSGKTAHEWRTISSYLIRPIIEEAIEGNMVIGWFQSTMPVAFGIDIDDHQGTGWSTGKSSSLLHRTYNGVRKTLPEPSLVVKSPRGLHLYYLMKERIPWKILEGLLREKVWILGCEILPTPNRTLRIPCRKQFLDPNTLEPTDELTEGSQLISNHPIELFEDRCLPEYVRSPSNGRYPRKKWQRYTERIESVERQFSPIKPGSTNDTLNTLVPLYRNTGMNPEEAEERLRILIEQSPSYQGELRNIRRLAQRIRSYYQREMKGQSQKPKFDQKNPAYAPFVDMLLDQSPFAPQRRSAIERFLYSIINWCKWHDTILDDPIRVSELDYIYPWYRKNRQGGYYPLPTSFLKGANSRYHSIVKWLKRVGVLEESPYKYSPHGGICKYYKVHLEKCIDIYKEQGKQIFLLGD